MKKHILPLCLCLLFLFAGCSGDAGQGNVSEERTEDSVSFFAMDTHMTITAYGPNVQATLAQAQEKIAALERLWTVTEAGGDLYAVNHAGGQAVEVSGETAELLAFALRIAEQTNGALDPTIYPISSAWGFTKEEYCIPTEDELEGLLSLVGYRNVVQNGSTVQLPAGAMLDFGAVAKGYSGDLLIELLRNNGVTSALLDLGGNVQTIGSKPDGSDWRIGLQDPTGGSGGDLAGILQVSDLAVVTSGAYERYFIGEDGKRYGHIVDPFTGRPVENGLLSVTVLAKEGKLCDALSTSLFVMGAERAIEFWKQNRTFDMILMTDGGDIYLTDGVSDRFTAVGKYSNAEIHVIGPQP